MNHSLTSTFLGFKWFSGSRPSSARDFIIPLNIIFILLAMPYLISCSVLLGQNGRTIFCMISSKYSFLKYYFLVDRNSLNNFLNFFSSVNAKKHKFWKENSSLCKCLLIKSCQYLFWEISFLFALYLSESALIMEHLI